jgi:P27 family predicted phage terminase small subunit
LTPDLPAPGDPLVPPKTLTREELAAWRLHAEWFRSMGIESRVDAGSCEAMVRALCRARAADKALARSGLTMVSTRGARVKRPEVSISRDSWIFYVATATQFGLTPAARAKLGGSGSPRERAGDVPAHLRDASKRR